MCQPGRPGPHGESQVGSPGSAGLPHDEVDRRPFVGIVREIAALVGDRQPLLRREVAQLAELRILVDRKIHAAIRDVGEFLLDKRRDDGLHLRDVVSGGNIVIGVERIEVAHVCSVFGGFAPGQLVPGKAHFAGLSQDVIVDIGHVLDIGDVVARLRRKPHEDIVSKEGKGMSSVRGVVRRDSADIDSDMTV